jgi:hypothetical protein
LASNPKLAEAGKILFFCGVLALCLSMSKDTMKVGSWDHPTTTTTAGSIS